MDVLIAIDRLDDFIHNAPAIGWSDDVRVDREKLLERVEEVRAALRESYRSPSTGMVEELAQLAQAARPVRVFGGVRIHKEQLYDVLDRMRATIPDEIRREHG
jgi:hypothetical protein